MNKCKIPYSRHQIALFVLFLFGNIYAENALVSICKTNKQDGHSIRTYDIFLDNGKTNLVRKVDSNYYKDGKTNIMEYIFYYNNIKVARYLDLQLPNMDKIGISTCTGTPYSVFIALSRDGRLEAIGTGDVLDPLNQLAFDFINGEFVPRLSPEAKHQKVDPKLGGNGSEANGDLHPKAEVKNQKEVH